MYLDRHDNPELDPGDHVLHGVQEGEEDDLPAAPVPLPDHWRQIRVSYNFD